MGSSLLRTEFSEPVCKALDTEVSEGAQSAQRESRENCGMSVTDFSLRFSASLRLCVKAIDFSKNLSGCMQRRLR